MNFPGTTWEYVIPETVGMDSRKLVLANAWLAAKMAGRGYRLLVIRHGKIALEENMGIAPDEKLPIASAAKSIYSSVFSIILSERSDLSPDSKVCDYFPEMLDVKEGEGPKPGRYAFEKDRNITFRQLIGNTSGYMKPGEEPGKIFHYQTFGMNIFTHALAKLYGYYAVERAHELPGFQQLIREKIADPIAADWAYAYKNFDHPASAKTAIFGNYCRVSSTALDLGRLGWLWCNNGLWKDRQVIPAAWHTIATKVSQEILQHGPVDDRVYGYGFWTNEHGIYWPSLPQSGYAACGAGGFYICVFPEQALVVIQAPGFYETMGSRANPELLKLVLDACE